MLRFWAKSIVVFCLFLLLNFSAVDWEAVHNKIVEKIA